MHWIQKTIDSIYIFFIKIKGGRKMAFLPLTKELYTTLTVLTIYNYEIKIHCKCVIYKYIYNRNFLPSSKYYVYSTYAECGREAPEILKEVIKNKVYFPRLVPFYISAKAHNRVIVEAYFDILISKLRNEKLG